MSRKIESLKGKGVPLRGNDIDTDRIIPARFMKCVTFEGLGEYAFYDARYDAEGGKKDHPFNEQRFKEGSIMVVNKNFGCGSSREHAPQALEKYGIRALIGESYAEIFAGNATTMGIPVVVLSREDVEELQGLIEEDPELTIEIDLKENEVRAKNRAFTLAMPDSRRSALLSGQWDSTDQLLKNAAETEALEKSLPYRF